jgi:hypothetical protein
MALIPGTLPSDTCYGTPQDLLELFAQYLDVPAFALNSKVVFSTSSAGLTADVVWFDTTTTTNPIMKITVSGGFVDYINNYLVNLATVTAATGDFVLVQDISDSNKSKKVTAQTIANLAPTQTPANGSITAPMLSGAQTGTAPIYAPRAWVLYDQTVPSVTASANVSTVTDTSTGVFTVNFSTALPSANYTISGSGQRDVSSGLNVLIVGPNLFTARSTTSARCMTDNTGNVKEDSPSASVVFMV